LIAVDTSVVVAAFASWHEGHRAALECLRRDPRLPAHVAVETFSVITRLPAPHRAPGKLVAEFLRQRFRNPLLTLPPNAHLRLVEQAAAVGLAGGAIYDAMIAATASGRLCAGKGGRLHPGMVAAFTSESMAGFARNTQASITSW
jgi:predicted nucleic acid-binding protein